MGRALENSPCAAAMLSVRCECRKRWRKCQSERKTRQLWHVDGSAGKLLRLVYPTPSAGNLDKRATGRGIKV
jgi:hypothetical protein